MWSQRPAQYLHSFYKLLIKKNDLHEQNNSQMDWAWSKF